MRITQIFLSTLLLFTLFINACKVTNADKNFQFKPGDSLIINGPNEVTIPQDTTTADSTDVTEITASYYVEGFTTKDNYSWAISEGAKIDSVYREGGYIDVTYTSVGTYSISVENEKFKGALDVTVKRAKN